ncbi:hypothetical protein [Mesorhizobium shangrilense]|uniref:Uncharacterized protein n=1 Tax=Mesorhizobium shangrilense TaxID=460060 RepID=A0ABV2DMU4_9HYPH
MGNKVLDASIKRPAVPSFEGRHREGFIHVQDGLRMGLPQRTDLPSGMFSQPRRNADVWNDHDINCRGNLAG